MEPHPQNLLPLGDFKPADQWQTHVNAIFYGVLGPKIHNHFQTYVSQDHRLAHTLAEEFYAQAVDSEPPDGRWFVQEWGVGNGNLAGCFLSHLKTLDREGKVYPSTHYILCDYSQEILKGARKNPRLAQHAGHFSTVQIDADRLDCFKSQSVDKIISNEIWDDLATKVLLKHDGQLLEEFLLPTLDPAVLDTDFENFKRKFAEKDLAALAQAGDFLQAIVWQRDYQRVDVGEWPFGETVERHADSLEEGIPAPINTGAFKTLERARELLRPISFGYTGFDYGMFSMRELNCAGRPYFNLYGGQYTFMVNFELLERVGQSIGFDKIEKQYQHRYVGASLHEKVLSLVEIVQSHPEVARMTAWERDILMLSTLNAVNGSYRSPYKNKMLYPPSPETPKKQRKQIAQLVEKLSPGGVPDTVSYVTESEVFTGLKKLRSLGYQEQALRQGFNKPEDPVSFVMIRFQ